MDLSLNNPKWLMRHKNQTKPNHNILSAISPKVNVMTRLELELAYKDIPLPLYINVK